MKLHFISNSLMSFNMIKYLILVEYGSRPWLMLYRALISWQYFKTLYRTCLKMKRRS